MSSTKGFSIVETVLVVALVILLGFVGWRMWEAKKDKGNTGQSTQQKQQTSEQKSEEYVTIAEWGVRFKIVEGLSGVEYFAHNSSSDVFYFTNKELSDISENCTSRTIRSFSPLGAIQRSTEAPSKSQKHIKQIENYYYTYTGPQSLCVTNSNDAPRQSELIQLFTNSFDSLEVSR